MTLTGVAKSWPLTSLHHGALAQLALRCCPSHACYCLLPSHCPCTVASSPRLVLCQLPTGNLSQSHNSIWPPTPPTPQDQDSPLHCLLPLLSFYPYCPTTTTVLHKVSHSLCVEVSASAARRHLLCCPPKLVGPPTTAFSPRPNNSLSCPPALTRATNCAVLPVLVCAYQDYCLPTAPPPPQFRFLWGIVLGYPRPSRC